MEDGRKAFEAMIEAAQAHVVGVTPQADTEVIENLRINLFARLAEWGDAGIWTPTEQHETVTAMLKRLDDKQVKKMDRADLGDLTGAWVDAGKPGLPKPVDPYGPEITVDTGGRCPVEGDEVVLMHNPATQNGVWLTAARHADWSHPRTFRRILADHPGDSYWHGKLETIPESGKAGLDVMDRIVNTRFGSIHRAGACSLAVGSQFRRWLKGDA